uniref:Protein phosphatase methylesterase 1 n=1 Tax=Astyanax mexicanus TaxID=7994 RepID=A0A8B9RG14_ASTMX
CQPIRCPVLQAEREPGGGLPQTLTDRDHGVGRKRDYSPVSWSEYFEMMDDVCVYVFRVYKSGQDGPLLVLLHGGGHSALSWAVFTVSMTSRVTCRVLAMDLRGHGKVYHFFSRDVANVVRATYGEVPPPIVLVGHSMGGAIAVHAASGSLLPSVVGLVVIDVVEGSAMDVLHSMQNFLKGRPRSFKSIDHAIEWRECAVVAQKNGPKSLKAERPSSVYSWKIDLSKAEKYWDGWFRGISNLFLSCNVPKLLLLAGIDRLDRDLTIGQMQGQSVCPAHPAGCL